MGKLLHMFLEWDRRRKFGCGFWDFLIVSAVVFAVNQVPVLFDWQWNVRMPIAFVSCLSATLLVNRNTPD